MSWQVAIASVAAGLALQPQALPLRPRPSLCVFFSTSTRLDGSMETTNEILDSASHDCPLVTQPYGTAVAKGTHAPASPTRLGKAE